MTLAPVSRPSVSSASGRTPGVEPRALRSPGPSELPGVRQEPGAALRRMIGSDGFDSPRGLKQEGGLEEVARVFARIAEVLSQSARLLGGAGGAGPQAPAVPAAKGAPVSEAQSVGAPGNAPKAGNTLTFTNDGTKPMNIQFTPNAGEKAVDPLTLAPGETRTVAFPQGWSGNFRSTEGDGKAATLGEVKFNGGGNQTYYDVSYIEGLNAGMTIQPEQGGRKSGTVENLLASAPEAIKAKDANGAAYGLKKTTTSNVQDPQVVDYFRTKVGADEGYVIPTDDASTLGTSDTHLQVRLKNLVA